MLDGHCGIVNVNSRDARFKEQPCQIAAVVPQGTKDEGGWMAEEWLSRGVSSFLVSVSSMVVVECVLMWGLGGAQDGFVCAVRYGCYGRGS